MRDSISITLMPGHAHGAIINGNDIANDYCETMLVEWLKEGKEINLVISSKHIPYTTIKLVRKDK